MNKFRGGCMPFCIFMTLSIFFFLFAGCGGTESKKTSYYQYYTEGTWKMVSFGYDRYGPFSNYGSLLVNDLGEITGGDVTNFGIDREIFRGGRLNVSHEGFVTGTIETYLPDCDITEKQTIPAGQMTLNRNIIVYTGNFTLVRKGIGILVKKCEKYTVSDLEGTWIFPSDGIFSVSVDTFGSITDCTFLPVEGSAQNCKGNIVITPEGGVSGKLEIINDKTFKIDFNGQMAPRKDSMILAGSISTRFEGMAILAFKREGIFSLEDGKGSWRIFITAYKDVLYGNIGINSSGIVTRGEWETLKAHSGSFTEGMLILTDQGAVSGTIKTTTGNTLTILGGQMAPQKDLIEFLYRDENNHYGVAILVKIS